MSDPLRATLIIGVPTPDGQALVMRHWFVEVESAEALASSMSELPSVELVVSASELAEAAETVNQFEFPPVVRL